MGSWRKILLAGKALFVIALVGIAVIWLMRKDIARGYADAEMKRRGVQTSYQITGIGPAKQRFEKIVIGDPAHPDLTADWAEVETHTGLFTIAVSRVRVGGVRLRGRITDGALHLGAVDKLLPVPTDKPFALPDIDVELNDARVRIDTVNGEIGARIDGKGNVADGFSGKLAAVMPVFAVRGVSAKAISVVSTVSIVRRTLEAKGIITAKQLVGYKSEIADVVGDFHVQSDEQFKATPARFRLAGVPKKLPWVVGRKISVTGNLGFARQILDGDIALDDAKPDTEAKRLIGASLGRLTGSPLEPLAVKLRSAIDSVGPGGTAHAGYHLDIVNHKFSASPGYFTKTGLGPELTSSGKGFVFDTHSGRWQSYGAIKVLGGGFPEATMRLTSDLPFAGVIEVKPYVAGQTRLALTPFKFVSGNAGLSLRTAALFDGPLGGGKIRGLLLPIDVRNGQLVADCLPVGFRSYAISSLMLAPTKLNVCLNGDKVRIANLYLAGRLNQTSVALAAASALIDTSKGAFGLDKVAIKLGDAKQLSSLDLGQLSGSFAKGTASGNFTEASGQIGNVPLLISKGAGDWRFAKNTLTLSGAMQVADAAKEPRFQPLSAEGFALMLANGKITARTTLHEPKSGIAVVNVDLRHTLSNGQGDALLDVPHLEFGQMLQPEALTTNTLGVIANVLGTVIGKGRINWTADGVKSSGSFRTDNLDFAAAFGPVTGLKGEIALSDLLGLETTAGQHVAISSINPGIAVTGGEVRYRLLPGLKIAIEGGRWPFAGGALILEPSTLDLNFAATRRLTFRVIGLDSALFIQQMAFENIAVTGRFDGILPMVFDQNGGRIEGGSLTVRPGGGILSYIGEVSNAKLGRFSKLAFDALKSIRYKQLTLELNGALDGEMVTFVRFNGVNQLSLQNSKNFFLKQFNAIPFIFNITIKAPFRGLFATVRSLNEPGVFLPNVLPPQFQVVEPQKPVQPKESDPVR